MCITHSTGLVPFTFDLHCNNISQTLFCESAPRRTLALNVMAQSKSCKIIQTPANSRQSSSTSCIHSRTHMHITSWRMNDMNGRWVNETAHKTLIIQQNLFSDLLIFLLFFTCICNVYFICPANEMLYIFSSFSIAHGQSHTIQFRSKSIALLVFTLQNVNKTETKQRHSDNRTIGIHYTARGSFSSQDCIIIVYSLSFDRSGVIRFSIGGSTRIRRLHNYLYNVHVSVFSFVSEQHRYKCRPFV